MVRTGKQGLEYALERLKGFRQNLPDCFTFGNLPFYYTVLPLVTYHFTTVHLEPHRRWTRLCTTVHQRYKIRYWTFQWDVCVVHIS